MQDKIKTIIIDDKESVIYALKEILEEHCSDVELIGIASSVEKGVDLLNSTEPELIFMDVELPDGSGFDILDQVRLESAEVVFITAFNEYAIRAFEFSAMHYILKPLKASDIIQAVERYKTICVKNNFNQQLNLVSYNLTRHDKRIALPNKEQIEIVNISSIVYFESVRNYLIFYLVSGQQIIVTKPMNHFERLLSNYGFFRIHHSYMINIKHMKSYTRGRGGYVHMCDGTQLDVSTRRKQAFLAEISQI